MQPINETSEFVLKSKKKKSKKKKKLKTAN